MYQAYWQLQCRPFESVSNPKFYYPGESHQGAMLKLRYAIENRSPAVVLAGPSGAGKTMLVHLLSRQLAEQFRPIVQLVFPQMPPESILAYLAEELGAKPGGDRSIDQSLHRIQHHFAEAAKAGKHGVLVIDEAQLITESRTLESIRLLLNLGQDGQPPFTLLLCGDTGLLPILDRMPTLEERVTVKCLLRSFTAEETASYISHRMQAAGAKGTVFEPDAFDAVHEATGGIPRRINRLCDLALLIGFAEQRARVGKAQIEAVNSELVGVAAE